MLHVYSHENFMNFVSLNFTGRLSCNKLHLLTHQPLAHPPPFFLLGMAVGSWRKNNVLTANHIEENIFTTSVVHQGFQQNCFCISSIVSLFTCVLLLLLLFCCVCVCVDISKVQDDEVGDGTTSVVVLACELLKVTTPYQLPTDDIFIY